MRTIGWIFATALSVFFVLGPAGVAEAQSYEPEELTFLELINDYRQQNGLGPLELSAPLSVASERHSEDMGTYGFFSHTTEGSSYYPVGSGHPERAAQEGYGYDTYTAENLAYGQTTADEVFEAWRVSPGHNVNMLGDYSVIGIGLVTVNGTPYWTTVFGGYVDPSVSGGSADSGGGNDAATPGAPPTPAEEETTEEPAATPPATSNEPAPEPGAEPSAEPGPESDPQRESAATEQYAAQDQYDAAETRAGEPSGPGSVAEEPSAERAAADQYADEDALARSAGVQEAAGEIAAADAVPADTSGTDGTEATEAEADGAEPSEAEAVETEAAAKPDVAEGEGARSTGAVKADGTPPSGDAGSEVAAAAGISTLPDTGGVPLPLLVGGVALLVGGFLARRVF